MVLLKFFGLPGISLWITARLSILNPAPKNEPPTIDIPNLILIFCIQKVD